MARGIMQEGGEGGGAAEQKKAGCVNVLGP